MLRNELNPSPLIPSSVDTDAGVAASDEILHTYDCETWHTQYSHPVYLFNTLPVQLLSHKRTKLKMGKLFFYTAFVYLHRCYVFTPNASCLL